MDEVLLDGRSLDIDAVAAVARHNRPVRLHPDAQARRHEEERD
jgi:histidine ammonia-lyase